VNPDSTEAAKSCRKTREEHSTILPHGVGAASSKNAFHTFAVVCLPLVGLLLQLVNCGHELRISMVQVNHFPARCGAMYGGKEGKNQGRGGARGVLLEHTHPALHTSNRTIKQYHSREQIRTREREDSTILVGKQATCQPQPNGVNPKTAESRVQTEPLIHLGFARPPFRTCQPSF
jgi:hypothetical protein